MTAADDQYWEFVRSGRLQLQQCTDCATWWFPPAERCSNCLGSGFEWRPVSGRGTLWSWVRFHKQYFGKEGRPTPYNVAMVRLDEGPRMITALATEDEFTAACDAPVQVNHDPDAAIDGLPVFRVRDAGAS